MKIKNKFLRYAAIVVIACFYLWIEYQEASFKVPGVTTNEVIYTKHALCRLDCRQISKAEVLSTINNGEINHRKSEPDSLPCPKYAYEVDGKKNLRIVVAACPSKTKIITAIDLDREFNCHCY